MDSDQRRRLLGGIPWWTYWVMGARAVALSAAVGAIAGAATSFVLSPTFNLMFIAIVFVACAVTHHVRQLEQVRQVMRRQIAEAFAGEMPPFCFECGYDVRVAGVMDVCPECGARLLLPRSNGFGGEASGGL